MTIEAKTVAARKAGFKAFLKCQSDRPPHWFTTQAEREAFRIGWWCGP